MGRYFDRASADHPFLVFEKYEYGRKAYGSGWDEWIFHRKIENMFSQTQMNTRQVIRMGKDEDKDEDDDVEMTEKS